MISMLAGMMINSQAQNPAASVLPQGPPALPMFIDDINGKPFSSRGGEEVEGNPFLFSEWNWGAVRFRNGQYAKDLSLQFNVHRNKLYFQRNGQALEFVQPVAEFMMGQVINNDSVAVIYRSGFPVTDKTNEETFFELLADGKIQLLKYNSKQIRVFKGYNQPEKKAYEDLAEYYIFRTDGKMVKIRKDKESLLQALPEQSAKIEELISSKKIKLKSESGLAKLIYELNHL